MMQGFGAATKGGTGQEVARVKNCHDGGPGSLREALSKGNRTIVFDVAGQIDLSGESSSPITIGGPFITIDGTTAPPPGITLYGRGLSIGGASAHDLIVRNLRFRSGAGIGIGGGAYNVVIDRVSVHRPGGSGLSIGGNAHDVTVCWSIFSESGYLANNSHIADCLRVSLHHNLFVGAQRSILLVGGESALHPVLPPPPDPTLDLRNNVLWGWTGGHHGLRILGGVRANVMGNLFGAGSGDKEHAATVNTHIKYVEIFTSGNTSADSSPKNPNHIANATAPYPVPPIATVEAFAAGVGVLWGAGARPLDDVDTGLLRAIVVLRK
jgi:hypothetical protein